MKRLFATVMLTLLLTVAVVQVGLADVTGLFSIDLTLTPQTNSHEAVPFYFDLQTNLQVNITISGMTLAMDLGFGTTGLEFALVSIGTNLGALSLKDDFVFATPFGCAAPSWIGVLATLSDDTDGGIVGQCTGPFVSPIGSANGSTKDNALAFVKKRVELQLDIAGISFNVLALFEDVDFPDIHGAKNQNGIGDIDGSDHEHDHFGVNDLYFVSMSDVVVDNQTPSFGFGTILTLSGQTVSGISVTGITGICANNMFKNRIKKRKFPGEVNKGCVTENGPVFAFDLQKLHIEGIEVGGVQLSTWMIFTPLFPISATTELAFSLGGMADIKGTFTSSDIATFMIDSIKVSIAGGNFSLLLEDVDANLDFDRATMENSIILNPNQNPAAFTSISVAEAGIGLVSQELILRITRSGLTGVISTLLLQDGIGGVTWDNTSFTLSADLNFFTFSSDIGFGIDGLRDGKLSLTVDF
jgi:hypothetical protein